jgi:trimeric autotransporter adhesin
VTQTFTATVTAAGTYCNEGQILSYTAGTSTWTPVDLKARACFTALESNLSIIKDFVADDNTTSLGKALTVAANQSAKLRVRVINNGTGAATGVAVNDVRTSGLLANYTLTSVSPTIPIVNGGFSSYSLGGLAAGATATPLLFTVAASADGTYCDTATVTATSGTIGIGSDSACLTVSTPNLTITKVDAPASVLPGATYTSTIVVNNTGTAIAKNVVISDLLGLNSAANVWAIYVS